MNLLYQWLSQEIYKEMMSALLFLKYPLPRGNHKDVHKYIYYTEMNFSFWLIDDDMTMGLPINTSTMECIN